MISTSKGEEGGVTAIKSSTGTRSLLFPFLMVEGPGMGSSSSDSSDSRELREETGEEGASAEGDDARRASSSVIGLKRRDEVEESDRSSVNLRRKA